MSEKKRRDITLGEMQDECTRIGGICVGIKNITEDCKYLAVCPFQSAKRKMCALNLTDPPRFNEQQMALLKGLYDNGVWRLKADACITSMYKFNYDYIGNFINTLMGIKIEDGETLDLAELLGKDGAE